ncbi:MAG: Cof-type HAD-IIB family hydrolase [Clostridia bacterium]|nr:Cof-type HAD-IIB family hydrolase [Clostridia bacterium]MDD4680740.1 Cof-type HAD-IIB family hydrolase [Clostridia bacterium]
MSDTGMKTMNYSLIAVDLDDSLLGSDLKISKNDKGALFAAREKGVQITIATGRMLDSAMPFIKEMEIDIPVITYQGAFIKDIQTGKTLVRKSVPMEYAHSIIDECKNKNLHIQAYSDSSYFFEQENQYSRYYHKMSGVKGKEAGNLKQFLEEEPIKLLIIAEPSIIQEHMKYFQKLFGDKLQVLISRPHYLEFTNGEATKGKALSKLGSMLGISGEETIAIGDSFNDISMIEYAGLGVAMGNAPDEVKSFAQYITRSNDEGGVADVVERFIIRKE